MSFLKHIKSSVQKLETYNVKGKPLSPGLIKLNQNENPFDLPDELKRELLEDFFQQPWNRYPEVFPTHLLEALSNHLNISMESIIAANGSNELMYTIGLAIIGKGTKVLIPTPTFFLYEKIASPQTTEWIPPLFHCRRYPCRSGHLNSSVGDLHIEKSHSGPPPLRKFVAARGIDVDPGH